MDSIEPLTLPTSRDALSLSIPKRCCLTRNLYSSFLSWTGAESNRRHSRPVGMLYTLSPGCNVSISFRIYSLFLKDLSFLSKIIASVRDVNGFLKRSFHGPLFFVETFLPELCLCNLSSIFCVCPIYNFPVDSERSTYVKYIVDRARIELATHGFSGRCSTN